MSVVRDAEDFTRVHAVCGGLTGAADAPTARGYRLWIACACGGMFEWWVTPEMADEDLVWSNLLSSPN